MTTLANVTNAIKDAWVFENSQNADTYNGTDSSATDLQSSSVSLDRTKYPLITLYGVGVGTSGNYFFTMQKMTSSGYVGYKPAPGKKFICLGYNFKCEGTPNVVMDFYGGTTDVGLYSNSNAGFDTVILFRSDFLAANAFPVKRPFVFVFSGSLNKYICHASALASGSSLRINMYGIEVDE